MSNELNLKILSPAEIVFEGSVLSVHLTASLGELEIFAHHKPFVSSLLPAYVTVHESTNSHKRFFVNDGYIEVKDNQVTLIADEVFDEIKIDNNFIQSQITSLSSKLDRNLDDNEYEKVSTSIGLYNQYIS